MQTQGKHGMGILKDRVKAYGVGSLWWGAWATAVANFVGSFPWFATVRCARKIWRFQRLFNAYTKLMPLSSTTGCKKSCHLKKHYSHG
jgi:hypothetical protein